MCIYVHLGTTSINNESIQIDEKEGIATATAVNFFNNLFDSVNGDYRREDNNELRYSITEDSDHHLFWISAKNLLRKMSFIDKILRTVIKSIPSLRNWILTIDFKNCG